MTDYKDTLNLPKTEFPMKANLSEREPQMVAEWDRAGIYQKALALRRGKKKFILHDGPPYANGHVHLGTAFNKILKDFVVRSRSMMGYNTPYVPGWDCHGMPIEHQVVKNLGERAKEASLVDIRHRCRAYAQKYFQIQREEFRRLGCMGDWANPYLTMSHQYEASIIGALEDLIKGGFIYRGLRPIHWCPTCQTALAEAEVEYGEHTSPSIYVKFLLEDDSALKKKAGLKGKPVYLVIWTTTPWTIPANLAIALHPDFPYVLVDAGSEVWVVAEGLLDQVMQVVGIPEYSVVARVKSKDLEKKTCRHPLIDRASVIVLGTHVTLDAGTGCVHTAPGHGAEDFEIGKAYNLPALNPVDSSGTFTEEVVIDALKGMNVFKANPEVVELLKQSGALVRSETVSHSYPHCWRCKGPLIFRATEQWFLKVDHKKLRKRVMAEIDKVSWIPPWGRDRIYNMVQCRPDWCLSRQRAWGVPLPALDCLSCGHTFLDQKVVEKTRELIAENGSDVWFERDVAEFLPDGFKCPECGADEFLKHTDILDVWFDSSVSQRAVLLEGPALGWPCQLYLEAVDQHRGWFQVSMLNAVAHQGRSPYEAVLTHGLILDEKQRKMSKSSGNVIAPEEVEKRYGADVLRLLFASVDYTTDISFSYDMLGLISETYRKIRNTFRYLLGNLNDFDPEKDMLPDDKLLEIDRWALLAFQSVVDKIWDAYSTYEFHTIYHSLNRWCTVELSSFYLDILKDRLYTEKKDGSLRRSAQVVLWKILDGMMRLIAPIMPFTASEIWGYAPQYKDKPESVFLADLPPKHGFKVDKGLAGRWDRLRVIREEATKALESARKEKAIGNSLEAKLIIESNGEVKTFLSSFGEGLPDLFIVSQLEFGPATGDHIYKSEGIPGLKMAVLKARGGKCARCWKYSESVGGNKKHPAICTRCVDVVR